MVGPSQTSHRNIWAALCPHWKGLVKFKSVQWAGRRSARTALNGVAKASALKYFRLSAD